MQQKLTCILHFNSIKLIKKRNKDIMKFKFILYVITYTFTQEIEERNTVKGRDVRLRYLFLNFHLESEKRIYKICLL